MVNNEYDNNDVGGPPPIDDSWWMAILEDVENRFKKPSKQKHQPKSQHQKKQTAVQEPSLDKGALADLDWERATELYNQDQVMTLKVTGYNRGGILVEGEKIKGFVPISHLIQAAQTSDGQLEDLLQTYQGKMLRLKIIECNPDRGRVVLSERAAETDPGRRIELLNNLQEGDCLPGHVTTITEFGVFVDLGGLEGLVHISELSWGRVHRPEKIVSIGDKVEVCVLQIDRSRSRVALSLKRLKPNPWETIETRYHVGQITDAVITNVVTFGAFARLEPGLDGLIHASEMGNNGSPSIPPTKNLAEGQRVQVSILLIDPQRQRLGLSLHAIYEDEAEDA
jgi:small subunit ribosomal protein S1